MAARAVPAGWAHLRGAGQRRPHRTPARVLPAPHPPSPLPPQGSVAPDPRRPPPLAPRDGGVPRPAVPAARGLLPGHRTRRLGEARALAQPPPAGPAVRPAAALLQLVLQRALRVRLPAGT